MDRLEPELEALRESYRARLPGLADELARLVATARRSGSGAEALTAARRFAHRLKGTSGSYGFDTASAAFAEIEAQLEGIEREPSRAEAAWSVIEAALERSTRAG